MRRFDLDVIFLFACIFILCVFCPRLRALDDWQPVLPEELKMTGDPAHPSDAVILYHEELTDDNAAHSSTYKRVKILTEKGKELANVVIHYNGAEIHVFDIKARTIAPDGAITPFSGKVFDTTIVKGRGVKYLAKTFTLPNVQVGSIIEWKYSTYWEGLAYAPHWIVQEDLPQKRTKFTFVPLFKRGEYVVNEHGVVEDRVYSQVLGIPQNSLKNTIGGRMEMELTDVPAFADEDYSPPADLLKMRVNFYYGTDKMQKPADFWKEEGKFWSRDVDRFIGRSSEVAAAASRLLGPADSPEQKIRRIYAGIQKMRNLNYQRASGSLEEALTRRSKEKRTVEDVLRNGAGFRDELTRTFVAMARAINVPAFVMRVSDRDEVFFQENVPDFYQLTSEIAVVVIDGKEVFLDPGTPQCPFGLLKWQHTGTQGIRQAAGGGSELAKTPPPDYKQAITQRVGRVTLSEDGGLRGKIVMAWTGEEAIVHRLNEYAADEAGRRSDLEDEIKSLLPRGAVVHFESATGWNDPDQPLSAAFTVEVPSYGATTGKRLLVPNALFEANSRQPFAHDERRLPIYFSYPFYTVDDVQITLPPGLRAESIPEAQPLKADYAFYELTRAVNGNTLFLKRSFAMGGIAFKKEDYEGLRKFYSGVAAGDSEQVVLSPAAK